MERLKFFPNNTREVSLPLFFLYFYVLLTNVSELTQTCIDTLELRNAYALKVYSISCVDILGGHPYA